MREQFIDYTKLRLGQKCRQWSYRKADGTTGIGCTKIAKCPKCGKKGEETIFRDKKTGTETSRSYTHKSKVVEPIPGFPMNIVEEYCSVKTEPAKVS